jgi:hypothetical protein
MAATLPDLEQAMFNAHKAGDGNAARKLAAVIKRERDRLDNRPETERYMDELDGDQVIGETVIREPEPTFGQQAKGVIETGATMLTGATSGLAGQIEGSVEGILREIASGEFGSYEAADRIEELAMKRAQQLTYTPKTEQGIEMTQAVGETLAPLSAFPPLAETQLIASAARQAAPQVSSGLRQAARQAAPQVNMAAKDISQKVRERLPLFRHQEVDDQSVGAAQVPDTVIRQSQADELPVPIKLTEGQKTRRFEDVEFEQTTAKLPEEGTPIRERFEQQNAQLMQNMDEFIDATGSEITDLRGVGELVDSALRNRAARDKTKIRSLYRDAEKAGEMADPVDVQPLARYLNENRAEREDNSIMNKVQRYIDTLEVGGGRFEDGSLQLRPMSLKDAESIRRFINRNVNDADPNDIRIASALKSKIDGATEGAGGLMYKQARRSRARYARDYENIGLVRNLLGLKRGTEDRAVALEDVVRKSILDPSASLDSVREVRRLLQTRSGEEGKKAWNELQGSTLRHIQEQMTKGVTTNQRGDRVVSPAQLDRVIAKLDKSGKLDFVFGKKGAEQLRTINDVAKTVLTAPPGTINTSNTATVLAGLMDAALIGSTGGVPLPIASGFRLLTSKIKDAKLKARVKKTLGD